MKKTDSDIKQPVICLFGASLDVGNMGCRALTVSLVKLLTDQIPGARIILMYGTRTPSAKTIRLRDRTVTTEVVNFRLSPRAKFSEHLLWILFLSIVHKIIPPLRPAIAKRNRWINTLVQAEFGGQISGGDSFSDIYGIYRMVISAIQMLTVKLLGVKLVLLPQTYGPYRSMLSRFLARSVINSADVIFARDRHSIGVIRDTLGIKHKNIEFCPDVGFMLQPVKPSWYEEEGKKDGRLLVGFNISGLLYAGGYNENNMFNLTVDYRSLPNTLIRDILENTTADMILIPHVFSSGVENDLAAIKDVYANIPPEFIDRVKIVDHFADQSEIKYIIGLCDFFIGSRMHSCIASLSQGIPTVGIAYSDKFKGVFDSVGLGEYVVDARTQDQQDISAFCLKQLHDFHGIVPKIRNNIDKAKEDLTRCLYDELNKISGHDYTHEHRAQSQVQGSVLSK